MNNRRGLNPLISIGFASLGAGYLYEWWRSRDSGNNLNPILPEEDMPSSMNGFGIVPEIQQGRSIVPWRELPKFNLPKYGTEAKAAGVRTVKQYPAGDIANRENFIIDQIRKDSVTPAVISAARSVMSGRCPVVKGGVDWCVQPKDWDSEVQALYEAVVNPNSPYAVRYTRDHVEVDLFGSSALMSRLPAEDCDGMTIRLGSLLRAVGYHVRTRVVAPRGAPGQWAHIYLAVSTPAGSRGNWRPLDPTEPEDTKRYARKYPFWEVGTDRADPKRRDRDV